jgi:hypothetical protein
MSSTRTAVSHSQRVALRHYYQTTTPKPTHAALRIWFKAQFGHEISQSIVSRSLSDGFACLDVCIPSRPIVSGFRVRTCQWPWLDVLLSDWLQAVEAESGKISNDAVIRKARQIWNESDKSQGLVAPRFSAGWIAKFRRRHMMRHRPLQVPDQQYSMEKPGYSSKKIYPYSVQPPTAVVVQTLEQPVIDPLPHSKTATRTVSTNSGSPQSQFSTSTTLTLPADHLLNLIQHNVFRALITNKSLLRATATFLNIPYPTVFSNESATRLCGGLTVIRLHGDQNLPDELYPTPLQMNHVHTSWIDMFPFPKFRDNLIRKGAVFSPEEMRQHLCGDLFPDYLTPIPSDDDLGLQATLPSDAASSGVDNGEFGDSDDYTTGRSGLIIWGEPWKMENWEVTPNFLRHWGWALEGCDDLIRASNRWRAQRDEKLLLPMRYI